MNSIIRVALIAAVVALVGAPAVAQADHKRNWHLGDRSPLKLGMRGHDVKVLQDFLKRAGLRNRPDGVFGKRTRTLVRRFERSQGFERNGIVHRRDMRALRAAAARAEQAEAQASGGGAEAGDALPPTGKATLTSEGLAVAPADAPEVVKQVIEAGNRIAKKPYRYGGGHGKWEDSGYDCSGSVSYALHGGGLVDDAMPSGGYTGWGESGRGRWITIYANGGHMYMVVAGLRFDTSALKQNGRTRWSGAMRSSSGYSVRHPKGL